MSTEREKDPEKVRQGRNSRRKGNKFMCRIANELALFYPNAHRGLQNKDGSEFADVEGTPFWIECKDQKKPSLFGTHRQCVEAQNFRTIGRGKNKKRVKRKDPDTRRRLIVLKQFGNGEPYACLEWSAFLELLEKATGNSEKK